VLVADDSRAGGGVSGVRLPPEVCVVGGVSIVSGEVDVEGLVEVLLGSVVVVTVVVEVTARGLASTSVTVVPTSTLPGSGSVSSTVFSR